MQPSPISPLDPTSPVDVEWTLPAAQIIQRWRETHAVEAQPELSDHEVIQYCRCRRTRLGFTWPPAAGGPGFYEQLERFPWYYRSGKWEHEFACRHIAAGASVLDVGCGAGQFLSAASAHGAKVEGIDFNSGAVATANRRGLKASTVPLAEMAETRAAEFDVVTALQVLEHIPEPRPFLDLCFRLLRPGGKLVIAVPDADGWLRRSGSVLELPPHHATHWNAAALQALTALYPAELVALETEPLDPIHARDFAAALLRPAAPDGSRSSGIGRRLVTRLVATAVPAVAARLPGITLAAVFGRK